jgi:hypothetical protein
MLKQLDTLIGFAVVMTVVSLLITIITQMISAFLGLRGKNLTDALRLLIFKIDPNVKPENAQALVRHILTNCAISDSAMAMVTTIWDRVPVLRWFRQKWKTATAIRPDELYEMLKEVRNGIVTNSAFNSGPLSPEASADLTNTAAQVLKGLAKTVDPKTEEIIQGVAMQANKLIGTEIGAAKTLIAHYATMTDAAFVNLEKGFNSVQDRARQWFSLHTRLITVAAAILAAFVLQLDTIALIKRLSADADLRAKLVAVSGPIQQQADNILDKSQRAVIDQAMHQAAIAEMTKTYPEVPAELGNHADFASIDEAKAWLGQQLASETRREQIIDAYEGLVTKAKLEGYVAAMQKLVSTSGLELLPTPYPLQFSPGWPAGGWPRLFISNGQWSWPKRRLLGIFISAALLSLGAPFWFNTLKSLTNLRPTLANAVEKKPSQGSAAAK